MARWPHRGYDPTNVEDPTRLQSFADIAQLVRVPAFQAGGTGSSPVVRSRVTLTQSVEYGALHLGGRSPLVLGSRRVAGSSPAGDVKYN